MERIEEYFKKRECDYWREYSHAYGMLNVYQHSIQIVGADCGSTALYFLLRGASFIVQYEREEHLRKRWEEVCVDFDICNKAIMKEEWNGVYENLDIFIMDCEGCEEKLNVNMLAQYKQWCVGIHDWTKNRVELMRKMEGTTFTYVSDDGREITLCKI